MAFSANNAVIRLVLTGARSAIAGLEETGAAISSLNRKVLELGASEEVTAKRSWLMNQAIFTMHRAVYTATLALAGAGALALKWGYDFNSAMQSATAALMPVMHNTREVKNQLSDLFQIAKYSPFQFKDMTLAFRSMYLAMHPLGISASTVTTTIQSLVDALSATGKTGPAAMNRVAVALQHMAFQGRLTGFTVNQLARDGIPIFGALNKELGLTGDQLHNISKLGIPAQTVLDAINKYIETTPGFMHAARIQARTLHGQLTTLRDNIGQVMGGLTLKPFTAATTGLLPTLNRAFDQMAPIMRRQQGRISLNQVFGVLSRNFPQFKPFIATIQLLISTLKLLWQMFTKDILPVLGIVATFLGYTVIPVLKLLIQVLTVVDKHTHLVGLAFAYFGTSFAISFLKNSKRFEAWAQMYRGGIDGVRLAWGRLGKVLDYTYTRSSRVTRALDALFKGQVRGPEGKGFPSPVIRGYEMFFVRVNKAFRGMIATIISGLAAAGQAVAGFFVTMSVAIYDFMVSNPITLIILAVLLLVTGLVILYFKWKWFHNLVNSTADWIWRHWKLVLGILMIIIPGLRIIVALIILVRNHWKTIHGWIMSVWSLLKDLINFLKPAWQTMGRWLVSPFQLLWKVIQGIILAFRVVIGVIGKAIDRVKDLVGWFKKLPFWGWITSAAKWVGNAVQTTGWAGVPAIAGAPTGGGNIPVANRSAVNQSILHQKPGNAFDLTIHNQVHIDGKQVAESTAKHRQNRIARK